jgi:hypothetical protein
MKQINKIYSKYENKRSIQNKEHSTQINRYKNNFNNKTINASVAFSSALKFYCDDEIDAFKFDSVAFMVTKFCHMGSI